MKSTNLNNTIKFIDKKAEYEEKKHNSKLEINKLKTKQNIIIGYEEHKKSKILKEKKIKLKNSKIYKSRKKLLTIFLCIFSLFVIFFLWNEFVKPVFNNTEENSFKVESQSLSKSEISTYTSIVKESVPEILNVNYKTTINQIHRNGNLIFAAGHFTVPEEGDISFDMILQDYTPYSLKINGEEYVKK